MNKDKVNVERMKAEYEEAVRTQTDYKPDAEELEYIEKIHDALNNVEK